MKDRTTLRQHRLKIAWLAFLLVMVLANAMAESSACSIDQAGGDCRCPTELASLSPFVVPPTVPRLVPSAPEEPLVRIEEQPLALTLPTPPVERPIVLAPKNSPPA